MLVQFITEFLCTAAKLPVDGNLEILADSFQTCKLLFTFLMSYWPTAYTKEKTDRLGKAIDDALIEICLATPSPMVGMMSTQ